MSFLQKSKINIKHKNSDIIRNFKEWYENSNDLKKKIKKRYIYIYIKKFKIILKNIK